MRLWEEELPTQKERMMVGVVWSAKRTWGNRGVFVPQHACFGSVFERTPTGVAVLGPSSAGFQAAGLALCKPKSVFPPTSDYVTLVKVSTKPITQLPSPLHTWQVMRASFSFCLASSAKGQ